MSSGYLQKDGKKIPLAFKDFTCPPEGGDITGHTTDGRTAKGKIQSNRRLAFTLEGANCDKLYFEGQIKKGESKCISGNYGFAEGDMVDHFLLQQEEVMPTPAAPVSIDM